MQAEEHRTAGTAGRQEPDLVRFGQFVREQRIAKNLTQTQLAVTLGWAQGRISVLENGKYGLPSVPLLAQLAGALSCPLSELLSAAGYPVSETTLSMPVADEAPADARLYALERLLHVEAVTRDEALIQASTIMCEVMGADKADVFLLDAITETLVAEGSSDTPLGHRQHEIGMDRMPLVNGGRTVEVFETGRMYQTGRADEDPGELPGVTRGLGIRSIVNVPIEIGGEIRGVLSVTSTEPDRFGSTDARFVQAAARWIAIILHRAELLRQ